MLTGKQEKFCQGVVSGLNASDAFRTAYDTSKRKPTTVNRGAKTLMDNSKIRARINALAAPILKECGLTIQGVLDNIMRLSSKAEEEGRYGEALKGQELLGKHLKMFTDQMLVGGSGPIEIVVEFIKPGDRIV